MDDAGLFLPEAPFIRPPPEPIQVGETLSRALTEPREFHTFEFQGQAGQVINIVLDGRDGLDPELLISGPGDGFLLDDGDDDSGPGLDAVLSNLSLPAAGTYTIEVRSSFDTGFRTTGPYTIKLEEAVP